MRLVTAEQPTAVGPTGLLRRLPSWFPAVGDQGVIAVENLGLSILFSRVAGLDALGVYSLISMTLLACLGFERTLLTDPWLASRLNMFPRRAHSEDQLQAKALTPQLRTLVWFAALLICLPTLAVCLLAAPSEKAWLLAVPLAPFFIIQDVGRYDAYQRGDVWRAFFSDTVQMVVVFTLAGIGFVTGRIDVAWIMGSWLTAYVVSVWPVRTGLFGPLTFTRTTMWWRTVCKPLGMPLLMDSVAFFVSSNVTSYLLAARATSASVGSVRVVTSIYSPIAMIFTGLTMWLVPALSRRTADDTAGLRRKAFIGLGGLGALATVAGVWLGPWIAPLLFGSGATPSRTALLIGGLTTVLNALSTTWIASVKVFGRYQPISWTRAVSGASMIVAMLVVVWTRSVEGYLFIVMLQTLAIAVVAWILQSAFTKTTALGRKTHD